ncbi:unnamed protein product, partial [Clonostachys solani]
MTTFYFGGDGEESEKLFRYRPGGLHPVILGEVLPKLGTCVDDQVKKPRYRILLKLGFGGFSTVWLARDVDEKRYVALKICQGSDQPTQRSTEAEILHHLHQVDSDALGHENILEIYDSFTVRGPNGFHACIVTEVVLPLRRMSIEKHGSPQRLAQQALAGFDFLHRHGVVHGDPHYNNFGIALPQLQEAKELDVMDQFSDPVLVPVVPHDPFLPLESFPAYLTETSPLEELIQARNLLPSPEEMCLKIIDFGRACWADEIPSDLPGATPVANRPPEVVMHMLSNGEIGSVWSKEADIWAIGCMIHELRGGYMVSSWGNLQSQLYDALCLGGSPPKDWSDFLSSQKPSYGTEVWKQPVFDTDKAWSRRLKNEPDRETFLDLIRKMVTTRPSDRTQIAMLYDHRYFSDGSDSESGDSDKANCGHNN